MSIAQYLRRHAEADTAFTQHLHTDWQHVLCVPAYDEADALPKLLASVKSAENLLLILLINSPQSAQGTASLTGTQASVTALLQQYPLLDSLTGNCKLLQFNAHDSHLLLLERYALPDKEAVGLARKIACDIACKLIDEKKIRSPWIHNSDADVILPADYLQASEQLDTETAAALFAFRHAPEPDHALQAGLNLYEYSLYYYVEALKWAGSPYAFHTIGSTLLVHHKYYALARGFPKRAAGEDFYLLNKLAKTGRIHSLTAPVITLSGRRSLRVPFGTGPAIGRIGEMAQRETNYLYYHPLCFRYLQEWLRLMPSLWETRNFRKHMNNTILLNCLTELGVETAIAHALQHSKSRESFTRHMHNWFDAFRTLKLIHLLRNKGLASISRPELQTLKHDFAFIGSAEQSMQRTRH